MSDAAPAGLNGALSGFVKGFRIRAASREMGNAKSILDLGSGLCEILATIPKEMQYVGVERDPWMFERARRLFPERRFHRGDIEDPAFSLSERVDRILMLAVWEHLHDPEALLRRAREWVLPGGRFIGTTPAPATHRILELGSKIGLLSRHADEEHERLWSFDEIEDVARRSGWTMVRRRRFLFGANQLFVLAPS